MPTTPTVDLTEQVERFRSTLERIADAMSNMQPIVAGAEKSIRSMLRGPDRRLDDMLVAARNAQVFGACDQIAELRALLSDLDLQLSMHAGDLRTAAGEEA